MNFIVLDPRFWRIFNNTVLVLLTLAAVAAWLAFFARPDRRLHLYFCAVGQGDAILIKTPSNRQILVDGGPGKKVLDCLARALPFYDRALDLVILTHPHADHLGGLVEVLKTYRVGGVVFNRLPYPSADYQEFVALINSRPLKVASVSRGNRINLDQTTTLEVYFPPAPHDPALKTAAFNPFDGRDVNDSSLIFRLVCGDFAAFLLGDAPAEVQKFVWEQGGVAPVAVLKVAHHGAADALDSAFLNALAPRLAVITVGAGNRFGHPHQNTLSKLLSAGAKVKRTDLDGTVEIVSDCQHWWLK